MSYRFKKEYRDAVISIPALRLNINRFNLTDELAEKIFKKFPQFAHNLEITQDPELMDERDRPQVNVKKTEAAKVLDNPPPSGPMIIEPEDPSDSKPDIETGIIGTEEDQDTTEETGGDLEYPVQEQEEEQVLPAPEPEPLPKVEKAKKVNKPKAPGKSTKGKGTKDK